MTHQVMMSAAKPDYLGSVLGEKMIEREGPLTACLLTSENVRIHMHVLIITK